MCCVWRKIHPAPLESCSGLWFHFAMPFHYAIDFARGIVFTRGWGNVTDDELRDHASQLKSDPAFNPGFRQFVDLSAISAVSVTTAGIAAITGDANPFPTSAVRAVFAPTNAAFGL